MSAVVAVIQFEGRIDASSMDGYCDVLRGEEFGNEGFIDEASFRYSVLNKFFGHNVRITVEVLDGPGNGD